VFGNTGFAVKEYHTADEARMLKLILDAVISNRLDRTLKVPQWPSTGSLLDALADFLRVLPYGRAKPDLSFLWMRTRSGPGMCGQRLIPAGHVTAYPYFDLDYVRTTLDIDPLDKWPNTLQARCLSKFWPAYAAFSGSRSIPPDSQPGDPSSTEQLRLACTRQLLTEVRRPWRALASEVTSRAYAGAALAVVRTRALQRIQWWLQPLLTLLVRQAASPACWSHVEE
jgi:hypothetical protein